MNRPLTDGRLSHLLQQCCIFKTSKIPKESRDSFSFKKLLPDLLLRKVTERKTFNSLSGKIQLKLRLS